MFLDDSAISAGAENGQYYSQTAMVVRATLLREPQVVAALQYAFDCCTRAEANISSQHRELIVGTLAWENGNSPENASLSFAAYSTMIRKLYLFVKGRDADADIDVTECLASVKEDWRKDSHGLAHLDKESFSKCWFELADLNVDSVRAEDYAAWICSAADTITAGYSETTSASQDSGGAQLTNARCGGTSCAGGVTEGVLQPSRRWLSWRRDETLLDGLTRFVRLHAHASCSDPMQPSLNWTQASPPRLTTQAQVGAALLSGRLSPDQLEGAKHELEQQRAFRTRRRAWEVAFSADEQRLVGENARSVQPHVDAPKATRSAPRPAPRPPFAQPPPYSRPRSNRQPNASKRQPPSSESARRPTVGQPTVPRMHTSASTPALTLPAHRPPPAPPSKPQWPYQLHAAPQDPSARRPTGLVLVSSSHRVELEARLATLALEEQRILSRLGGGGADLKRSSSLTSLARYGLVAESKTNGRRDTLPRSQSMGSRRLNGPRPTQHLKKQSKRPPPAMPPPARAWSAPGRAFMQVRVL